VGELGTAAIDFEIIGIRVQRQDLDQFEPRVLCCKLNEMMGYRVDVGGIQIEPIASHLDIIRIRRLENNQSAVAKHSKSLLEKLDKHFERQMLEDMEAGDSSKGTIAREWSMASASAFSASSPSS